MNVSCAICGDIFIGLSVNEQIFTTQCGHLFHYHCLIEWFERSKTCPQCRNKASEKNIIRIFFNNSSLSAETDSALLKHTVDSLEFQLKMKESELKKTAEEKIKAQSQNEGLRKEVKEMKQKVIANEQVAHTLRDEVKSLRSYCKNFSEVKLENEELKQKLIGLNSIKMILNGTCEEAECVIDNTNIDAEYLQHCLKKMKQTIKKLECEHKNTEKELFLHKRKLAEQNKVCNDVRERYEKLKQDFNRRKLSNSSCSANSFYGEELNNDCSTNSTSKENLLIGYRNEFSRNVEEKDSCEGGSSSSNSVPQSSTNNTSPLKNIQFLKRLPLQKSKSSSLVGVIQPKLQMGRIPKTSSSLSASGDDVFIPNKYVIPKITKKTKKLSASAISGVQIGVKKFKGL